MMATRSARLLLDSAADWLDIRIGLICQDAGDPDGILASLIAVALAVIGIVSLYMALDVFGGGQ